MASKGGEIKDNNSNKSLQKSYFDVLGLCCSSEVPLIEKILRPLEGVVEVSVMVPSRTVIVVHDNLLISQLQIVKALNQARLEANVRMIGKTSYRGRWPSPYVILCGLLLALSLVKYVYPPFQWLAVAAVAVGIWPIIMRAVVAIRNFTLDVNMLMLIAVVGTIAMKDYMEAGTIVFLFTIAEWLESRASHKATAVMSSLMNMAPQKATIAETGEVVNVEDVKVNTILAVKAGEIVPVDGIVVDGTCEVDEKTLTGESFPVPKQKDSVVYAGTVNVNGYVSVKTTALAEDCAVAKMARLVEEAQNKKSSVERLIDRCTKYYMPAVVLISAGLAVVPVALKLHDRSYWFHLALVVLVSACPCGLILSTPVATFCALSTAATNGLLIKGGDYLEILAKIKTMAFDKTGTITRGEFTLMNFQTLADDISLSTLLYWVSSIESKSSHPIAAVLVDYARSQSIEPEPENVEEFQNFPGEGVFGKIDERDIYIGNQKVGQRAKCTAASNIGGDTKDGRTSGYIYSGAALIGTFSLSDNCRSGALDAIKDLKSMGIRTALLTGDGQSAAIHAQEQLGHALDVVHAELLPEDKARIIEEYKREGPTAMVGDGVNDAPALATADIGISMGVSGSALAKETGHVVLMSNDIRKLPKAIKLARKTRRKVVENIFFSIATKAGVIAFAFATHPLVWLAVLVDVVTCLIVILNSMLLLRGTHGHGHGHGLGGKCLGLFSCHSHKKTKCHSTSHHHSSKLNPQCCSKSAAPKTCDGVVHQEEFPRHSSHNCSTPCQKSSSFHSTSSQKCCLESAALKPCESTSSTSCQTPQCCRAPLPTIPESLECSSQNCSSSCQTSKCTDSTYRLHHHLDAHDPPHDKPSSSRASECQPVPHNSNACEGNFCEVSETCSPCCGDDHRIDLLESHGSCGGAEKLVEGNCCNHDQLDHVHDHDHHDHVHDHDHDHHVHDHDHHVHDHDHHVHDHDHDHHVHDHDHHVHDHDHHVHIHDHDHDHDHDEEKTSDDEKNGSKCKAHCPSSHGIHGVSHHHVPHGMCHGELVAKHACLSLRRREVGACCKSYRKECCSSQGHFVAGFGALTEIVTE